MDVAAYKNADALVHVVRAFDDPTVPHPSGSIDPARDAQAMEDELILADLGVAERRLERLEKDLKKSRTAELERERDVITLCKAALEEGRPLRTLDLKGDDLKRLRGFQFLSAKPLLIVINLDESQLAAGGDAATQIDHAAEGRRPDGVSVARSAPRRSPSARKIELEIAQLEAADAAAFLADLGLSESGLDRVIRASYDLLGYISFFTVGEDECRAWSIPAPHAGAAGRRRNSQRHRPRLHPRGSRQLRRADRTRLDGRCRDHGEVRLEGKEYVVQDGDIINFRFAT